MLVWIGVTMACFPIFYAVIENDLRRVLSYSMINQLGFMVVGVGIGGARHQRRPRPTRSRTSSSRACSS